MGGDHIPIASPGSALPSWGGPSPGGEQGQRRTWTEHSIPLPVLATSAVLSCSPSHPLTHASGEWSGLPLPQGWAQGSEALAESASMAHVH